MKTLRVASLGGLTIPQAEWLVPDQDYFALDKHLGDVFLLKYALQLKF